MLKKLPVILILVIILSILFNSIIPLMFKQIIFACSLTIKSIVLFLLPFVIFGLLFKTFVKLADNALSVIVLIFGGLCLSNLINTFLTHYVGSLFYQFDLNIGHVIKNTDQLAPYFSLQLPQIIKNDYALFGGIICGVLTFIYSKDIAVKLAHRIDIYVKKMFSFISLLIPLFIVGFVIKCASEDILLSLIQSYSVVLAIFLVYASLYTFLYYFVINKCVFEHTIACIKNMMPALVTALSSISSVITMPITILSTEKNVKNKDLAASTISATVNIHLLGDCLAIPLLAYALLKHYGIAEPALRAYFIFTVFFVIAKFSVAAVPAGGIIIMTPILEKYLGFTPEMSSLIIAIYVIFDPFVTGFNVLGNGAFAKLVDQLYYKIKR